MIAEAVTEAIAIAREAEVPVHISHHKVAGRKNWGRSAETLALVARARAEGTDVSLDVYPYAAASTLLYSLLPPWVQEGGVDALLERLGERQVLQRLASEIEEGLPGWENIPRAAGWTGVVVASSPAAPECEGRSIADLAEEAGLPALDYTAEFLKQTDGQVIAVLHLMAEDDVRSILAFDGAMIGSDGLPLPGKPHPRVAGTFGRVLGRYTRQEQLLRLPQALRKMTALPAERFGLADRGVLAVSKAADVVVFSAETVADRASFSEPLLPPEGVLHVLVGGRPVVADGELTGLRPGRVLAVGPI
jgi:N-acyl-D-amino-acid deacylase